jgi:hypothetical protein
MTMTGRYASAVADRLVDRHSPLAAYVQLPRSYVILQRINLGLYALLGELSATADWRRIAEEIWPFTQAPPSTPIGTAEAAWRPGLSARADRERRFSLDPPGNSGRSFPVRFLPGEFPEVNPGAGVSPLTFCAA